MEIKRLRNNDTLVARGILKRFTEIDDDLLPSREYLDSLLHNDSCYIIAALENDVPLGFVMAYRFPSFYTEENTAYLYDIEVMPDHRNKGIGKQLIRILKDHLSRDGVKEIWLGTGVGNIPAQQLFGSTGAEREEETFYEYFYYLD